MIRSRPFAVFGAYNEHALTAGGTAISGKVSPLTGKPLFAAAIGHRHASVFEKPEISIAAPSSAHSLKVLAFESTPSFNTLTELERAIGRPLVEGEWLKVYWSELTYDGSKNWNFDENFPVHSAKFQIDSAVRAKDAAGGRARSEAPVISFIKSLTSTRDDGSSRALNGQPVVYVVRKLETGATPIEPGSTFARLANHPTIASLKRHQVTAAISLLSLGQGEVTHVPEGAQITIETHSSWDLLPKLLPFEYKQPGFGEPYVPLVWGGEVKWVADGQPQKPISFAEPAGHHDPLKEYTSSRDVVLPLQPGVREIEFWLETHGVGDQAHLTRTVPGPQTRYKISVTPAPVP